MSVFRSAWPGGVGGAGRGQPPEGTPAPQVCWKGLCQDLHVYRSRNCSAQCSGHGVRGPVGSRGLAGWAQDKPGWAEG